MYAQVSYKLRAKKYYCSLFA